MTSIATHPVVIREVGMRDGLQGIARVVPTADLVAFAKTLPGLAGSVLVPNLRGAERAIEPAEVLRLVQAVLDAGVQRLGLAAAPFAFGIA